MNKSNFLKVALAQISPVWLDKKQTIQKIENTIEDASKEKAELIVFGEALLPGYPFWIGLTNGATWNSSVQKEIHAHYVQNSITIEKTNDEIYPVNIKTSPYPGFPTDLQAQWMAIMILARGSSKVTDMVYYDRFSHIPELNRFGANIRLNKNTAHIDGVKILKGAPVMSTDIRASASLIIAGLAAEGVTEVSRIYHIDRGYEKIENKFKLLGAEIWRKNKL